MDDGKIIEIIKLRRKKERYGRLRIAKDFGLSEVRARELVSLAESQTEHQGVYTTIPKSEKESKPNETGKMGISIDQIREKYDNTYIVSKNAENLKRDIFLTNSEFVQLCNFANSAGYKNATEHPQFDKYHGRAGGVIYWSHPDSIKKLKDEAVLK